MKNYETTRSLLHIRRCTNFSSSTLFESGWDRQGGLKGWRAYQLAHTEDPMAPGPAFRFITGMLSLNQYTRDADHPLVQTHVVSQQDPHVAVRFLNSLEHHGFTGHSNSGLAHCSYLKGGNPLKVLRPLQPHLYLSSNKKSVQVAIQAGFAAAHLIPLEPEETQQRAEEKQLVIATDGDAVLFGDEAEKVFREGGMQAFDDFERKNAGIPLSQGPLFGFLKAVNVLRSVFPDKVENSPLQLILTTARGASAQTRVFLTLREWKFRFDSIQFLSGKEKGPFLQHSGADIFFDDSGRNISSSRKHGVPAGHVPWGIANAGD